MIRKGSVRIAPINLNTAVMVKPTIRNGRRINQINGKRKSATNASGQQIANNKNQRIIARKILIEILMIDATGSKTLPDQEMALYSRIMANRMKTLA